MGTCGIAAGAKATFDAILAAVDGVPPGQGRRDPPDRLHGAVLRGAHGGGGHARHARPPSTARWTPTWRAGHRREARRRRRPSSTNHIFDRPAADIMKK
ncbi:MAG: hypothetical protein MZV70_10975 [Desulfobacterales bacterium]|nr:hypothetical protein [Desulfobacterales bacterium]